MLGSQFNIRIPIINLSLPLASWGNNLIGGMMGNAEFENKGIPLPVALYPRTLFAGDEEEEVSTGRLYGQVVDHNGNPVEGARAYVRFERDDEVKEYYATTNELGFYHFLDIICPDPLDFEDEADKAIIEQLQGIDDPGEDGVYVLGTNRYVRKGDLYYDLKNGMISESITPEILHIAQSS